MKRGVLVKAVKEEKEVCIDPPARNITRMTCGCWGSCVCIQYVSAYDHTTLRMPNLVYVFVFVKILRTPSAELETQSRVQLKPKF